MRIAVLGLTLTAAIGAAWFEVRHGLAQDSPEVPTIDRVLNIRPEHLAAGYLAVDATAAMIEMAVPAGVTVDTTLDGKKQAITKSNVDTYLKAYRARLEIYRQAIEQRGFVQIAGRYALDAGASCQGQNLDLREMFAAEMRDGKPVMAGELTVRQTGFRADIVLSAVYEEQSQELVYPGVVVEDAIVFAAPANMEFNFWGRVQDRVIELRLDLEELQSALGVPESDRQTVANCVFTLTPK